MNYVMNGKKLGVLAGMGPAAGAEFLRLLTIKAPACADQEHPVVYMISDTQIPDRSPAILGRGPSPINNIRNGFEQLIGMGADILACPCNSAHYFIDLFEQPLDKPLVHIIEETVLAAKAASPNGAWMISTLGTRQSGLYQKYADKHNYRLFIPSDAQAQLSQDCIVHIKANEFDKAAKVMENLVGQLWAEHDTLIMTACTELPLAYAVSSLPKDKEVSSLGALADACLKQLFVPTKFKEALENRNLPYC
mgnify:CR=1 FL=1